MPLSEASVGTWLFVFARLAGWAMLDPMTGRLPLFLRLMLAAVLAAALAPAVATPLLAPFTLSGALALALEAAWGAALALCVWFVFAAVAAALTWTGHTATAGLLTLTETQAQAMDAPWRALAGWLAALAFLGASGHLLVVDALRESLRVMPVAVWPASSALAVIGEAGGWLIATGVQLALPLLALALLIQLALAIVARTTPGLDAFSVGLGVASLGLLVLWTWAVPIVAQGVDRGLRQLGPWIAQLVAT